MLKSIGLATYSLASKVQALALKVEALPLG